MVNDVEDRDTDTLKNIKLTPEGKKPLKEVEYVKEEKRAEILWDDARDAILMILKKGIPDKITSEEIDKQTGHKLVIQRYLSRHALSIVELARLSKDKEYVDKPITKSQVIHHLPILIEHGYVVKYGTVKKGKRSTDYYRRTSKVFFFTQLPGYSDSQIRESYKQDIKRMGELFDLHFDEATTEELLDLFVKADSLIQEGREYVVNRARSDIARIEDVELHRSLYRSYAFKFEEWIETNKRIREILFQDAP